MKIKFIFLTGSALVALLGAAVGTTYLFLRHFSQCQTTAPMMGVDSVHEWAHQIGLSKEQEARLAPSEASLEKSMQAIQVKLAEERIALCRLIQEEPADSRKIGTYAQNVSALEAEEQSLAINHLLVMRDILNPEQRSKLFAFMTHRICTGCRQMVPGQKCLCGLCDMKEGS